jgi:hypothetical protein
MNLYWYKVREQVGVNMMLKEDLEKYHFILDNIKVASHKGIPPGIRFASQYFAHPCSF